MLKISILGAALVLASQPTYSEPVKLTGAQITKALSEHVFISERDGQQAVQLFKSNGATFYSAGPAQQQGTWQVKGDKYCSVWPPSENVACYDVVADGPMIRFVSDSGKTSDWKLQQ